jgi:methylmalonyl-CoA mutase N-terminal domain/subunit
VAGVRRWRSNRDRAATEHALEELRATTERGGNVMPSVLAAVRAGATLGEVSDIWRSVFGEQAPSKAI